MTRVDQVHAAAEEGREIIKALIRDLEAARFDENPAYQRRQGRRLKLALAAIDREILICETEPTQ